MSSTWTFYSIINIDNKFIKFNDAFVEEISRETMNEEIKKSGKYFIYKINDETELDINYSNNIEKISKQLKYINEDDTDINETIMEILDRECEKILPPYFEKFKKFNTDSKEISETKEFITNVYRFILIVIIICKLSNNNSNINYKFVIESIIKLLLKKYPTNDDYKYTAQAIHSLSINTINDELINTINDELAEKISDKIQAIFNIELEIDIP